MHQKKLFYQSYYSRSNLIKKSWSANLSNFFWKWKYSNTWGLSPTGNFEAASQLYNALHKLDQLHLDVIIAEDFLIMVWEEPLMTASKGQQQNKITSKQQLSTIWTYYLKTSPIQHYYSFFIRYHRCSSKSDLEIPENSSKFISLYLLFSIGFKGGQNCRIVILHLISFGPLHSAF
jgi:hypothetical protein